MSPGGEFQSHRCHSQREPLNNQEICKDKQRTILGDGKMAAVINLLNEKYQVTLELAGRKFHHIAQNTLCCQHTALFPGKEEGKQRITNNSGRRYSKKYNFRQSQVTNIKTKGVEHEEALSEPHSSYTRTKISEVYRKLSRRICKNGSQ